MSKSKERIFKLLEEYLTQFNIHANFLRRIAVIERSMLGNFKESARILARLEKLLLEYEREEGESGLTEFGEAIHERGYMVLEEPDLEEKPPKGLEGHAMVKAKERIWAYVLKGR